MGHSAYQRGSKAISEQIQRDYLDNGGQSRINREILQRAENRIEELEEYCLQAQSYFAEISSDEKRKGMVLRYLTESYNKKRSKVKMDRLLKECVTAHSLWVDSDTQFSLEHIQCCRRKAKAWIAFYSYINEPPTCVLPFKTPII